MDNCSDYIANINTVSGSIGNVNTTAGSITNVNTTAGSIANVNTTAGSIANVNTVAGAIANVNTTAGSITNVNTVASNITDVNTFANRYRIASSNPSTSLDVGDLYFNTSQNELRVYNGSAWQGGVTATGSLAGLAANTFTDNQTINGNIIVSGTVDGIDVAGQNTLMRSVVASTANLNNGVTATTQSASDNSTKVATTAYVTTGIANAQAFPSGTKMLFQQTSAPTGWTKVTSGVDNKALRVVSGTAGSGGSNAFSNTLASRSITANAGNTTAGGNVSVANSTAGGNVSVANTTAGGNVSVSIANASTGGTVNSHTLSTSEMPSHSHNMPSHNSRAGSNGVASGSTGQNRGTGSTGGRGGHSHGFTGGSHNHNANASFSGSAHNHNATFSGSAHNHNASFSGSAHNHSISVTNLDLAVQYLDVIIASKD